MSFSLTDKKHTAFKLNPRAKLPQVLIDPVLVRLFNSLWATPYPASSIRNLSEFSEGGSSIGWLGYCGRRRRRRWSTWWTNQLSTLIAILQLSSFLASIEIKSPHQRCIKIFFFNEICLNCFFRKKNLHVFWFIFLSKNEKNN